MYILIDKNTNKVTFIRDKKPISYSDNLILAEVETLPEKYDYLTAENIREEIKTWTEMQEEYYGNGEIVAKEVERERTYTTCDLKACFNPAPTAEQLEKLKQKRYEELCKRYIRQKYSVDDELGIARQKDKKPEKYETYYNYVEDCLARARKEVWGV